VLHSFIDERKRRKCGVNKCRSPDMRRRMERRRAPGDDRGCTPAIMIPFLRLFFFFNPPTTTLLKLS